MTRDFQFLKTKLTPDGTLLCEWVTIPIDVVEDEVDHGIQVAPISEDDE